jgi:hypothetical protein
MLIAWKPEISSNPTHTSSNPDVTAEKEVATGKEIIPD